MKNEHSGKDYLLTALMLLLIPVFISCKTAQNEIKNNEISKDKKTSKQYMKEGFISNALFMVLIVEPKENIDNDNKAYIMGIAKKRVFISMQNYIRSSGGNINHNTKAALLNLIKNNGNLKMCVINQERRNVHAFEIRKENLKHYLDKLAAIR